MRILRPIAVSLLLAAGLPAASAAQQATPDSDSEPVPIRDIESEMPDHRWSIELLAGPNIPTGDLGLLPLETGVGFEVTANYRFHEHLWVYAGWGWHRFATDDAEADIDIEQTGYTFGGRFEHPFREGSAYAYRIQAAGTWEHAELEDADGVVRGDSGHELGVEVGAGVVIPLGRDWRLLPTARFRTLPVELSPEGGSKADLTYVAIEIGAAYRF